MRADKFLTVMAAVATTAVVAFATAPSVRAQAPQAPANVHHHAPVRVTVQKRSYLHPGTETKTHAEHYADYYHSPTHGFAPMRNSTLFQSGPGLPYVHDRMPFPNCLDLAGFCQ